jgi:hypothetical protein
MGFNGDLVGFHWEFMGFNGDLVGIQWRFNGNIIGIY